MEASLLVLFIITVYMCVCVCMCQFLSVAGKNGMRSFLGFCSSTRRVIGKR
jgi:hypothetical protein